MIGRIDQAVLLLQDRLEKLANKSGARTRQAASGQSVEHDPIEKLRLLRKGGQLGPEDLGRALVRSLLAEALGSTLVGSLDFQAIADQVAATLAQSETGRHLVNQALIELGID